MLDKFIFNIFCYVVDNYGDAGVCLRLGNDLIQKGYRVRIFCSDLKVLNTIINANDTIEKYSFLELKSFNFNKYDIIINGFSYNFSEDIAVKLKQNHNLIINLEYLSAEKWVESCHKLPSPYLGLNCYYFFPGFNQNTGGVLIEKEFKAKFYPKKPKTDARDITLFSYANIKVLDLLKLLSKSKKHNNILVFEGLALNNINKLLKINLKANQSYRFNNITLYASKMVSQKEYDNLLLASDLNLVRGEDSIIRAILCGRPFLWQIYEQQDDIHIIKLNNFFDRFIDIFSSDSDFINKIRALFISYNNRSNFLTTLTNYDDIENEFFKLSVKMQQHLLSLGSLSDNLLTFIKEKL